MFDCVIVGGGPCGLSCATYLQRFNRNIVIINKEENFLKKNNIPIDNYFGYDKVNGADLIDQTESKLRRLGLEVINQNVIDIVYLDNGFKVVTNSSEYLTKNIVLCIGIKHQTRLPNLNKFLSLGVSYCATCDGFFYKDKTVGLYGSGDYLLHELEVLKPITKNIIIFSKDIFPKEQYKVIKSDIVSLNGDNKLTSITTKDETIELDGLFIADETPGVIGFSKKIGLKIAKDRIVVDRHFKTNIDSIYAGGDCIGGLLQITKASYDGMMIATEVNKKLNHE
jgi:thioredoxin reductase (NADPH)